MVTFISCWWCFGHCWNFNEYSLQTNSTKDKFYEKLLTFGNIWWFVGNKYQQRCQDLWANISIHAKILNVQISVDVRRSLGKYQKICEDNFSNISRRAKICGQISEVLQSSVGKYQMSLIGQFYWERESVDLNFGLLQFFCCSHFLSADLACLYLISEFHGKSLHKF